MPGMDDHELTRFIDDPGGSALGRSLIASAHADVPSLDGRARAARRLGIAAVLAVGAGAGTEAGALAAVWKLTAVVVALGGVVGLAIWQAPVSELAPAAPPHALVHVAPPARGGHGDATEPPTMPPSSVVSPSSVIAPPVPSASSAAPQPPASHRTPSRGPRAGASPPAVAPAVPGDEAVATPGPAGPGAGPGAGEEPPAAVPEIRAAEPAPAPAAPEPVAPPVPEVVTPPPAEIAAGPGRLAAEVALVDRARTSLGTGDYPAAKAALAEYHQRFASGDLDAEADVVMIELLIAEREIGRARTLGTGFLARFPRSPLAQRVHSLLDRLPK